MKGQSLTNNLPGLEHRYNLYALFLRYEVESGRDVDFEAHLVFFYVPLPD